MFSVELNIKYILRAVTFYRTALHSLNNIFFSIITFLNWVLVENCKFVVNVNNILFFF